VVLTAKEQNALSRAISNHSGVIEAQTDWFGNVELRYAFAACFVDCHDQEKQ
jgi:hypothetical protein